MIKLKQYARIAKIIAESSHCTRSKVGALLIRSGNILSIGYNGTPRGFSNVCEDEDGNTKKCVLHAESNAIAKIAKSNEDSNGCTLITTMAPCYECAKLIIQSGIKFVYYIDEYRNVDGIDLLKEAGIYIQQIDMNYELD